MCAFDSWTRRGFAEQIRRWKLSRYAAEQTSIWRICKQIRALSRQRSLQIRTVGYSTISEALTETGPSCHEGRNSVSVKPPLPVSPAAQPRLCRNFWLLLFPRQNDSPISLQSKRGETAFDFKNLGGQPEKNENTHPSLFHQPRPPKKPALTVPAAQLSDHLGFNRPFNAFGDHFHAQIAGQPGDGAHDGAVGGVVVYVMNKTAVNLQPLHRQAVQIAQ